jgi:integral membrane protein
MKKYFTTTIGRLRLFAFLEGISLLVLVFIAVPLKYYFDNPSMSKSLGPVHGALFLLFVFNALRVGVSFRSGHFTLTTKFFATYRQTEINRQKRAAGNSGLAQAGVQFSVRQFFVNLNFRLRRKICGKSPRLRQAAKR